MISTCLYQRLHASKTNKARARALGKRTADTEAPIFELIIWLEMTAPYIATPTAMNNGDAEQAIILPNIAKLQMKSTAMDSAVNTCYNRYAMNHGTIVRHWSWKLIEQ